MDAVSAVTVDPGGDARGVRQRGIGLVVPFDFALDRELWRWTPSEVDLYLTRTSHIDGPIDVAFAAEVADADEITRATRNLSAAGPGVTAYGCTSGSFVDGLAGERRVRQAILRGGGQEAITSSGALLAALEAVTARRVAVATPYDEELTLRLVGFLEEAGHEVVSAASLGLRGHIADVGMGDVVQLAEAASHPDADALFLSCTNLRTLDALPVLEERLDRTVLSANLVTMWASLRVVGALPDGRPERLFRRTEVSAGQAGRTR